MSLTDRTAPYLEQRACWPTEGRHLLAAFDAESIVVYQAYRPSIGRWAVEHQRFGGEWSFDRMSWIKPNFLWMMYRCGWAQKVGQEIVLAVRLARAGFDAMLDQAVHSSYVAEVYGDHASWQRAVKRSSVRLQWDPDHDPRGAKQTRRAIQLGLRGEVLRDYATTWCLGIEDVTPFVREQHAHVRAGRLDALQLPRERVYPVGDPEVAARLGLAAWTEPS
jgi:hypothetical protein